jgi:hypothetical protein
VQREYKSLVGVPCGTVDMAAKAVFSALLGVCHYVSHHHAEELASGRLIDKFPSSFRRNACIR